MSTKILEKALRKLLIISPNTQVLRSELGLTYYPSCVVSSYEISSFHRFTKYFNISVGVEIETGRLYVYFWKKD